VNIPLLCQNKEKPTRRRRHGQIKNHKSQITNHKSKIPFIATKNTKNHKKFLCLSVLSVDKNQLAAAAPPLLPLLALLLKTPPRRATHVLMYVMKHTSLYAVFILAACMYMPCTSCATSKDSQSTTNDDLHVCKDKETPLQEILTSTPPGVLTRRKAEDPAAEETPDAHAPLSEAAEWSLTTSDTELLQALLKAGLQINEPVDGSFGQDALGWTLLHFAAGLGNERYIQFLLDHGADVSKRDRNGTRPIDIAFEKGMTNVCQQLENPKPETTLIDGFPEEILEGFFRFARTNAVLVCINGKDPSETLLKWIRCRWPNADVASKGEKMTNPEPWGEQYQNAQTQEKVATFTVAIDKITEQEYTWHAFYYETPLSGWFENGKFLWKYGCWLVVRGKGGSS
jgi:hypothetical protein